ncbi:hypothetical protein [Leifsonia sp. AG29]|uniref:hypothetical protein n=1 Tax=Leifsonia sp. AG29 TaxID=2598860 RepID=UPI00131BD0D6|nr:hypothetical protein [Leifsonia sp. AG29]
MTEALHHDDPAVGHPSGYTDMSEIVTDWSQLWPKRAYLLRSPDGHDYLSTFGGPGEQEGSATFFVHAPGYDGEMTLNPGDGWTVLRAAPEQ